jgi:hypothetical protein
METTFNALNQLESDGVIKRYAVGGAFALLFYTEPSLTYDVDIFVFLPDQETNALISLDLLYRHLESKGYAADKEHVMIEGVPVQFIPAYNELVAEALGAAVEMKYKNASVRVVPLEYLMAIMLHTNRPKDRARVGQIATETPYNKRLLQCILKKHELEKRWEVVNEGNT